MWLRRTAACALTVPLALLLFRDTPVRLFAAQPAPLSGVQRPAIVSRAEWHADEALVKEVATTTGTVQTVFIHHTGHANGYSCADTPAMLRAMEESHIRDQGWDDIGYNFVVDRCGTIYEGRAGSIGRSVLGAHTTGFNAHSVGIAALGTFHPGVPGSDALIKGIAKVGAWKLDRAVDPRGLVRMVSTNDDSLYPRGQAVSLPTVAGHRDTYQTHCPGDALYAQLPLIRTEMARLRNSHRQQRSADGGTGASDHRGHLLRDRHPYRAG
ncbi:N-acetylmuramoyl-L-alanine amidase [Streptomyces sp. NPDC088745]|uniref:N-acetylmuramoyl-L-alanine amidase n=1 Tax=Streptomyces sp. NPDC088745 TaxID=3365884 RepID=UPI00382B5E7B